MPRTRKWPRQATVQEVERQAPQVVAALEQTANQVEQATNQPDEAGSGETRRLLQPGAVGEVIRRNRFQLIPHYLAGGVLGVSALLHQHAATTTGANLTGTAVFTALAAAGIVAAGLWWARRKHHAPDGWGLWSIVVMVAVLAVTMLDTTVGVTYSTAAATLACGYALGARWWKHHRHQVTAGQPAEQDIPITDELIALFQQRWADFVGCADGVLAGTVLTFAQRFDHGIQYTLALVGGKHDLQTVESVIGKIATGLQHPAARLIVEVHESENPALLSLTVVTSSPITESVFFETMPTARQGFLPVGPYADGRGDASYRLYKGRRMLNGFVVGSTDSGKSRFLEQVGLLAMYTTPTYVIHVDGMNGSSCPALWAAAHERYGARDVDAVLDRLAGMQEYRERQLRLSAFRATPDYPGVLVIVDEFHRLLPDKQRSERWSNLAREANKCGIGILGADQDATKKTWGDGPLRASLQAGNTIGFRIKDRAAGRIVDGGSGFNLFDLPKRSGTGYVFDSDEAGARQAQFRSRWLPDYDDAYPLDMDTGIRASVRQIPHEVTLIEEWYAAAPKVTLDVGTDQAGTGNGSAAQDNTRPAASAQPAPRGGEGAALVPMAFPTIGAASTKFTDEAPEPNVPTDAALSDRQYQALDAVQLGAETPGDLAEHLQLTTRRVSQIMAPLVEAGWVEKTGSGRATRYTPTNRKEAVQAIEE